MRYVWLSFRSPLDQVVLLPSFFWGWKFDSSLPEVGLILRVLVLDCYSRFHFAVAFFYAGRISRLGVVRAENILYPLGYGIFSRLRFAGISVEVWVTVSLLAP